MFPTDPNAPGGPNRSESVRRDYAGRSRFRRARRLLTLAEPRPARPPGWPPVRQLSPLDSEPAKDGSRTAA